MSAFWLLCLCIYAVKPANSAHFMGGIIQWRLINPGASDRRVSDAVIFTITQILYVFNSLASQLIHKKFYV